MKNSINGWISEWTRDTMAGIPFTAFTCYIVYFLSRKKRLQLASYAQNSASGVSHVLKTPDIGRVYV